MTAVPSLRARVRSAEKVVGTFLFAFPTVGAARAAAGAGADFVLIDGEHTGFGWESIAPLVSATRAAGSTPIVRVPSASRQNIGLALDMGAGGVMIPMVAGAEEAAAIASWSRYPPEGVRGAMFGLAAHDYEEVAPLAALAKSNDETLVIVQIETVAALEDVEQIAATPGVDVIWVGHFDLSASMGIPTQFEHPDFLAALDRVVAAGAANGKPIGYVTSGADDARALVERGFTMLAYGSDIGIYRQALRDGLTGIAAAIG